MTTAYHPQADGQAERAVKSVVQILRSVVSADQKDWVAKLPMTEFAINSSINASIDLTPFEANYGWLPTMLPVSNIETPGFHGVTEFAARASMNIDAVRDAIIASRVFQTHHANKRQREEPILKEGDQVYLSTENLNLPKGRAHKLLPKYIGPYSIIKANAHTSNYQLDLPPELAKRRIHSTFHISKLRPFVPNDDARFPRREVRTYYDFGDDPEAEWVVEEIVGHRWTRGKLQFLVNWSEGPPTWEPLANCDELQALDEYLVLHGVKTPGELSKRTVA
jgi:hypothetical protein